MNDPIANVVGELVVRALWREGRRADIVSRPDQADRSRKAADFLLAVDGTTVALEVTTTGPEHERRLDALSVRLADRVRSHLSGEVTESAVGRVVVYAAPTVENGVPPSRRDVDASVASIVDRLRTALPDALRTRSRLELGRAGVVQRLTIHVYPNSSHGISVISQSPRGGFVVPMADEVARRVVQSKSAQLAQYGAAQVALVQNVMVLEPDDLGEAFVRLGDDMPPNWMRVWVVDHHDEDWTAIPVWSR